MTVETARTIFSQVWSSIVWQSTFSFLVQNDFVTDRSDNAKHITDIGCFILNSNANCWISNTDRYLPPPPVHKPDSPTQLVSCNRLENMINQEREKQGRQELKCSLGMRFVAYKHTLNLEKANKTGHDWFGRQSCSGECVWKKPFVKTLLTILKTDFFFFRTCMEMRGVDMRLLIIIHKFLNLWLKKLLWTAGKILK